MDAAQQDAGRSAKARRIWSIVGLVAGALLTLFGLALVAAYVFGAVVDRLGEPDQSLLFWYLPFLLIGIMAVVAGAAAAVLGFFGLRKSK